MAGSGRRIFAAGEVLTASNVMNYLQDQTVMNFAGTAARGTAIGTAVAEGMVTYLKDSNSVEFYDGALWNSLPNGIVPTTSGGTNSKAYLSITTTTTIGAGSTVDVTGSSMTFTAIAGRVYKVHAMAYFNSSSASGRGYLQITDGSNNIVAAAFVNANNASGGGFGSVDYIFTGTGSKTFKVRLQSIEGTNSVGYAGNPVAVCIEDIGSG